jgi:hypothetical protein
LPNALRRAAERLDLASSLKICSYCLGDLVARADADGSAFICTQCHQRTAGRSAPLPAPAAIATLALPTATPPGKLLAG